MRFVNTIATRRLGGKGNRSVWPLELQPELRWWLEKLMKFLPLRWFTLRALPNLHGVPEYLPVKASIPPATAGSLPDHPETGPFGNVGCGSGRCVSTARRNACRQWNDHSVFGRAPERRVKSRIRFRCRNEGFSILQACEIILSCDRSICPLFRIRNKRQLRLLSRHERRAGARGLPALGTSKHEKALRCVHLDDRDIRAAAERIGEAMDGLTEGTGA